jgi:Na+-driven multidrug efflux pump
MLTGILVFTAILNGFGNQAFLFWQLLWSFISYSIVLDFGMGFTIQRLVATKSAEGKMHEMDGFFTTAFWTFVALGIVSFIVAFLLKDPFLTFFKISDDNRPDFGLAYLYFVGSVAFFLPIGLFPAALIGIQKQYWYNWFCVASSIDYLILVTRAIAADRPLSQIMLLSMLLTILPYILSAALVLPMLKVITLNRRKYRLSAVREQLSFSLIAYCNTCNNK